MSALGYLALAWLLGVAAAAWSGGVPWAVVAAAALVAVPAVVWRPRAAPVALLALALTLLGGWRFASTLPRPGGELAPWVESGPVRLRAVVEDGPQERPLSVRYRLSAQEVLDGGHWRPVEGGLLLTTAPFPRYRYGDLLELEGELQRPPSFPDFDYRAHLERQGIAAIVAYPEVRRLATGEGSPLRSRLVALRDALARALARALPEPEASLAQGVLLGRRGALPSQVLAALDATGTAHLLAVSGQNVTLLAGLAMGALSWLLGRRRAALLALAVVAGYCLLVGGQPPVVRAAIMGGLYILARLSGRLGAGPQALALAGAAMTAHEPQVVGSVSFQLSFAATLGLMALSPRLMGLGEPWLARLGGRAALLGRPLLEVLAMTLAAIVFTLPLVALNFERVSLVAPVANLLAVPAFPLVLATSALTAAGGLLWPAASTFLGWLAWPPAAYTLWVTQGLSRLPMAIVTVEGVGLGHAIAYALALGGLLLLWRPRMGLGLPRPSPGALAVLAAPAGLSALALAVLWLGTTPAAQGRLVVTFLDVGQGSAVLVATPAGHRLLIDGGPSGEALASALGRNLPFWQRHLDLVVLTSPRAGRLTGLIAALERYQVRSVLATPQEGPTVTYRVWRRAVAEEGLPYQVATAGLRLDLGGATLEVLHPPEGATAGGPLLLRLSLGRVAFLLPSEADAWMQVTLLREGASLQADLLQVPGTGGPGVLSPLFLEAVGPRVAVVSAGIGNRFGHPAPETLALLQGLTVFRTDQHGDVSFETDGQRLWVRTRRPAS